MNVRIHGFEPVSRANGPGRRSVIWFQGCTLGCPGCFNPETHAENAGHVVDTAELVSRIGEVRPLVEGVTFSGGEPLQQPEALLEILHSLASSGARDVTTLCFSGYTRAEIQRFTLGPAVLDHLDVLVAGRYAPKRSESSALPGSSNQTVHFLSGRYSPADIARVPRREIILHADGSVAVSGVDPWRPDFVAVRRSVRP